VIVKVDLIVSYTFTFSRQKRMNNILILILKLY